MPLAKVECVEHFARETPDMIRFINFYQELFGFEEIHAIDLPKLKIKWIHLPGVLTIHVVERIGSAALSSTPKPFSPPPIVEFFDFPCGDHFCFTISNFDSFVQTINEKGIETFLFDRARGNDRVERVFFFDPDGNLLEVQSHPIEDE